MTVLVEDLLSLARLDEGRGIDITQQVKLTFVVRDAADDLHALDPDRGISCGQVVLQPSTDMDHPAQFAFQNGQMPQIELKGDASRLRQVVTNIVGNIHRYTPADSPVEISMGVLPASISPESLSRMPSNEQSLCHLVEAIEVGQSMQVGMNYAMCDSATTVPACRRRHGRRSSNVSTPPTRRVRVRRAVRDSAWQSRNPWSRRIMDSSAHPAAKERD